MNKFFTAPLIMVLFGILPVMAEEKIPDTRIFQDVKTVEEVQLLIAGLNNVIQTPKTTFPKTAAEQLQILENNANTLVQGGERILEIAKDNTEREIGIRFQINGLKTLVNFEKVRAGKE
ncbi:MAG: hypothetical protein LBG58_03720 [Planctomycetaceae bacterium]|jgi:hypothetical protein|nr:hypothetical protein [Planctomycetaceae bacterium]